MQWPLNGLHSPSEAHGCVIQMYGAKYSYAANIEKPLWLHNSVSSEELIALSVKSTIPLLELPMAYTRQSDRSQEVALQRLLLGEVLQTTPWEPGKQTRKRCCWLSIGNNVFSDSRLIDWVSDR